MKIALYIEDGLEQIVLTPTSESELAILSKLHDGTRTLTIRRGQFYACQGGWVRWREVVSGFNIRDPEQSTMIVLEAKPSV